MSEKTTDQQGQHRPASSPPASPDLRAYLARQTPELRRIIEAARLMVHMVDPRVKEQLKWGKPWFIKNGGVCYASAERDHVEFGFNRGSDLPDPDGRLEGHGKGKRHVTLRNVTDVDATLKKLTMAAFALDAKKKS